MTRGEITEKLNMLFYRDIAWNKFYVVREMTMKRGSLNYGRVDFVMNDRGVWRFYEVKSCEDDFYSGANWNFYGNYNYFIMLKSLYDKVKGDIPGHVGVYVCGDDYRRLYSIKRASYCELEFSESLYDERFLMAALRDSNTYNREIRGKVKSR